MLSGKVNQLVADPHMWSESRSYPYLGTKGYGLILILSVSRDLG